MIKIDDKIILNAKYLILVLLTIQITLCTGQVIEKSDADTTKIKVNTQALILKQSTTFPQIHTNLNGMVREFVRTMHQDKKGNFWFGTNGEDQNGTMWFATDGNGIFKYSSGKFTHLTAKNELTYNNVADILEDTQGNIWFTAEGFGVYRYDGNHFK